MSSKPTSDAQPKPLAPETQPKQETQDRTICLRSVKTSCWLGIFVFVVCIGSHHTHWAWGFLIGALLSLFSMVSLMLAVPFLTWSGAPRHMSAMMMLTMFMKIPIFCMGLYLATHLPGVSVIACCAGIGLTPTAITLKAIGNLINDYRPARQPKPVAETKPETAQPEVKAKPMRKISTEFAPEQG